MPNNASMAVVTAQLTPIFVVLGVMTLRVLALVLGYRVVKLGYEALIKGVAGNFDFGGKVKSDVELKLVSTSPGLLFVLLGVALMGWALLPHSEMTTPAIRVEQGPAAVAPAGPPAPVARPDFD